MNSSKSNPRFNPRFNSQLPKDTSQGLNGHMGHKSNHKNFLLHDNRLKNPRLHLGRLLFRHDGQLMVMQNSLKARLLSRDGNPALGGHLA